MKAIPEATRPHMPGYGILPAEKGTGLLPWDFVDEQMASARSYWVSCASLDGQPHATPVFALWFEGVVYFSAMEQARKARLLLANPRVVVHLESADDCVIMEGRADLLKDDALGEQLDELYLAKYGHPLRGDYPTFAVRPHKVLAWREADFPGTATRWVFAEG